MNLDRGINPIGCGGTRCPNMAHRVVLSSSVESHMALFPSLSIFALVNSGVFLHRKDNNAKKYTPRRYPTGQTERNGLNQEGNEGRTRDCRREEGSLANNPAGGERGKRSAERRKQKADGNS
jgi:hypothetical protein